MKPCLHLNSKVHKISHTRAVLFSTVCKESCGIFAQLTTVYCIETFLKVSGTVDNQQYHQTVKLEGKADSVQVNLETSLMAYLFKRKHDRHTVAYSYTNVR